MNLMYRSRYPLLWALIPEERAELMNTLNHLWAGQQQKPPEWRPQDKSLEQLIRPKH